MVLELLNYITTNKYLHSLIIFAVFFIFSEIFLFISQRVFLKLTKKTKTEVDDLIVAKTSRPISFILILIGVRLAIIPHLIRLNSLYQYLATKSIYSLIAVIVAYIIILVFDIVIDNWLKKFALKTNSRVEQEAVILFRRFSRIIFSIIALLFILDMWGVKIGPLLASLGIAGVAVAFALQNTLGNIFGGISLIVDKSITVDDFIKLDDGTQGFILEIGLRSTRIKSPDGDLIIIPNGKLADSKIYNYHRPMPLTRITADFGVRYGTDIEKAKKIVLNELRSISNVMKDPAPAVVFDELGDSALKFKALFWVKSIQDRANAKEAVLAAIYNSLNKNKIDIPFPTRTIHIKKGK